MFQVRFLHENSLTESITFWQSWQVNKSILLDIFASLWYLVVLLILNIRSRFLDWLRIILLLGLLDRLFYILSCHDFLLMTLAFSVFFVLSFSFSHHFFEFLLLAHLTHVQFFELSFFSLFTLLEQLLNFRITCTFIVLLRFLVLIRLVILSFLIVTAIFGLWEHFNVFSELVHLVFGDFLHFHLQFQLVYFHFKLKTQFAKASLHWISTFL